MNLPYLNLVSIGSLTGGEFLGIAASTAMGAAVALVTAILFKKSVLGQQCIAWIRRKPQSVNDALLASLAAFVSTSLICGAAAATLTGCVWLLFAR